MLRCLKRRCRDLIVWNSIFLCLPVLVRIHLSRIRHRSKQKATEDVEELSGAPAIFGLAASEKQTGSDPEQQACTAAPSAGAGSSHAQGGLVLLQPRARWRLRLTVHNHASMNMKTNQGTYIVLRLCLLFRGQWLLCKVSQLCSNTDACTYDIGRPNKNYATSENLDVLLDSMNAMAKDMEQHTRLLRLDAHSRLMPVHASAQPSTPQMGHAASDAGKLGAPHGSGAVGSEGGDRTEAPDETHQLLVKRIDDITTCSHRTNGWAHACVRWMQSINKSMINVLCTRIASSNYRASPMAFSRRFADINIADKARGEEIR